VQRIEEDEHIWEPAVSDGGTEDAPSEVAKAVRRLRRGVLTFEASAALASARGSIP
jgi:hypothetical protein